jgi:hypothetical protein
MTFEIKGLVDYRLDRVDTTGEGTSRGPTPAADSSSSAAGGCTNGMVDDSWCLPRLPFELVASPKNGCFSPITEAWTVFTSRPNNFLHARRQSYHHAATAMETNRKRKASDDGLREAKQPGRVCETSSTSGVRSTRRLRVAASRKA